MAKTDPAEKDTPAADAPDLNQLELFEAVQATATASKKTDESLQELLTELRAERQKPAKTEAPKPETVYTAAQLQKFVDEGKITQADAMEYLAEVKARATAEKVKKDLSAEIQNSQVQATVAQKIDVYRQAIPELSDRSSDAFKEAQAAFSELVEDGENPKDLRTQLRALQICSGRTPGKKQTPAPRETTADRQRTVESGGSSAGRQTKDKSQGASASGLPTWLKPEHAAIYEERIKKGIYKGAKDANLVKELEFLKRNYDRKKVA